MSIMPIEGVAGATGVTGIRDLSGVADIAPSGDSAGGFGAAVAGALESVQGLQSTSDGLAIQAATGELTDVHDYMIASSEAKLATEITVAVRNKAVEAFSEIMRLTV